jgi:hypothetical protein
MTSSKPASSRRDARVPVGGRDPIVLTGKSVGLACGSLPPLAAAQDSPNGRLPVERILELRDGSRATASGVSSPAR